MTDKGGQGKPDPPRGYITLTHYNIIYYLKKLPPFWICLINCLIPKRERLVFGIISSKASKTIIYGLPAEESNVATVVAMNQRHDNFFLNTELLLFHHSGYSVSNEYIPPGSIIVYVPSPNHSL